jgi:hypothetical protein
MKSIIENSIYNLNKKTYYTPKIECIKLDNKIALILSSSYNEIPFGDPGEDCQNINSLKNIDSPYA